MLNTILDLYAYTAWANHRIVEACAEVPEAELARDLGGSFPSILAVLGHVTASDWMWMERWHGRSPTAFPAHIDTTSLGALSLQWRAIQDRRLEWIHTLDEADLGDIVHYRNTAGVAHERPLSELLFHVVNHSTYHRGQVVVYLRQLGHAAPSTDLIRRER